MIRPHFVPEDATSCEIPRRRLAGEALWCYGTQDGVRTIYEDAKARHQGRWPSTRAAARKRRRVAPLPQWLRFLPRTLRADRAAQDLCDLMERLNIRPPLPMTPSQLAWRLYAMSIAKSQAFLPVPVVAGCVACTTRLRGGPMFLWAPPAPSEEPEVWVYDINQAYAHHLAALPELEEGSGIWRLVDRYAGPWGVYHLASGFDEAGRYLAGRPDLQPDVIGGWVWESWRQPYAEGGPATSFSTFLARCTLAHQTAPPRIRGLIKRLPVLFVGKCYQHQLTLTREGWTWAAIGSAYPPVWTWVIGALRLQMETLTRQYGPATHAFFDALHLRRPLPAELVADQDGEPGKWKLLAHGRARYLGLNTFVVDAGADTPEMFRHQLIEGPESEARAQFERLWAAATAIQKRRRS